MRDARGQATTEYVALVALVGVVLALAAGLTSGGVGGQVLAGLQRGLCHVADTACPRPQPPRADLPPCPVETRTRRESLDGALELVRLGHGGTLTTTRHSDGRVTVTLADDRTAGGELGAGLRVALGRRVVGGSANAGLSAEVVSGRSWTLPDADAARAFVARHGAKATVTGKALDLARGGCWILCDALGWRPHARLPTPDETYLSHGAAASAQLALGPAGAELTAGAAIGARLAGDGTRTAYVRLDAAAAAQLDLAVGLRASATREVVLSYAVDAQGRPVELGLHVAAVEGGGASAQPAYGDVRGALRAGAATATQLDAVLDLHDRGNRAAAAALVAALHDPLALGTLRSRAAAVRARILHAGRIDRRSYAVDSSALELGATLALGGRAGATFARTRGRMRLVRAETRLPGLPFLPRDDCRPG
jgi:hypothetical protein